MIRRLSSRSLLVSPASSSSSPTVAAARCSYSDSIDDSGNGRSGTCTSLSSSSSSSSSAAGRLMCDTAEGVYTQMMMRTFAASANANMNANAADVPCGGGSTCKLRPQQRASPSATSSIFGDSPAAVATSLMGCFFFGTTYGYYIGGAVKDAAMSKFGGGQDE